MKMEKHFRNKNKQLLKEFRINLDCVGLVFFLDMLEIKVDYLLKKDLEMHTAEYNHKSVNLLEFK